MAPVTIAVLAVTVSATAVAFFVLRGHAEQVEERRLGEEAQLGVIAFDSVAQEIESIVAGSNAIAVATDGDPAAFEATLRARTEMSLISSLVLLRVGVDEFRPLSEVGRRGALLPRALGPEFMQRMDEIASAGRLEIVKLATLNEGRVLGLAARAEGAGDYLVYAELLLPEVLSITGSSETPDVRYALYVDEELESSLILSNSDALPIEGRRVTRSLRLGNERPLFVFASNESLAGAFATALPWARSGWGWPSRPSWRASSTQRSAAPARRSTWFTISSRRTPSSIGARSAIVACSRMPTISSSSRTWTESSRRSTGRLGNSSAKELIGRRFEELVAPSSLDAARRARERKVAGEVEATTYEGLRNTPSLYHGVDSRSSSGSDEPGAPCPDAMIDLICSIPRIARRHARVADRLEVLSCRWLGSLPSSVRP